MADAAGRVRGVWQVLAAVAGLALFAGVWWKLPPALYRHVNGDAQVKAITDTRTGAASVEPRGRTR